MAIIKSFITIEEYKELTSENKFGNTSWDEATLNHLISYATIRIQDIINLVDLNNDEDLLAINSNQLWKLKQATSILADYFSQQGIQYVQNSGSTSNDSNSISWTQYDNLKVPDNVIQKLIRSELYSPFAGGQGPSVTNVWNGNQTSVRNIDEDSLTTNIALTSINERWIPGQMTQQEWNIYTKNKILQGNIGGIFGNAEFGDGSLTDTQATKAENIVSVEDIRLNTKIDNLPTVDLTPYETIESNNAKLLSKVNVSDYEIDKGQQENINTAQSQNLINEAVQRSSNDNAILNAITDTQTFFKLYNGLTTQTPIPTNGEQIAQLISKGAATDIPSTIATLSNNILTIVKPTKINLVTDFTISGFNTPNKTLNMRVYINGVLSPYLGFLTAVNINQNGVYRMVTEVPSTALTVGSTVQFRWIRGAATGNISIGNVVHQFVYSTGSTITGGASLSSEIIDDYAVNSTEGINPWKTQIINIASYSMAKQDINDSNLNTIHQQIVPAINELDGNITILTDSKLDKEVDFGLIANYKNSINIDDDGYLRIKSVNRTSNENYGSIQITGDSNSPERGIVIDGPNVTIQNKKEDNTYGPAIRILKNSNQVEVKSREPNISSSYIEYTPTTPDSIVNKKYVDDVIGAKLELLEKRIKFLEDKYEKEY